MMPKVLLETTLNPKIRRLLGVGITVQVWTNRVIDELSSLPLLCSSQQMSLSSSLEPE